jgi:hypothetical protein
MTYGCHPDVTGANCFCQNGFAATTGTCSTGSVISAAPSGPAACCKYSDSYASCSCWAFVCDNYAAGLSTTDCTCGWFGATNPQTSCTGPYCCVLPPHGSGSSAESGACHCGDMPCNPGETQVTQCDSSNTRGPCEPGTTQVMACD